jgi:hypothetical protein
VQETIGWVPRRSLTEILEDVVADVATRGKVAA